jgi:hypothetical protein
MGGWEPEWVTMSWGPGFEVKMRMRTPMQTPKPTPGYEVASWEGQVLQQEQVKQVGTTEYKIGLPHSEGE